MLFSVVLAALISGDGRSNGYKGVQLIPIYRIIGMVPFYAVITGGKILLNILPVRRLIMHFIFLLMPLIFVVQIKIILHLTGLIIALF